MADTKTAPPYVLEVLMELVKRSHADPEARNVYLNPRRADQALVSMEGGKWAVISLAEVTRHLFDGVVKRINVVILTDEALRNLPFEAQNALAIANMMYQDDREDYIKMAKGPMAAHLTNMAPASGHPEATPGPVTSRSPGFEVRLAAQRPTAPGPEVKPAAPKSEARPAAPKLKAPSEIVPSGTEGVGLRGGDRSPAPAQSSEAGPKASPGRKQETRVYWTVDDAIRQLKAGPLQGEGAEDRARRLVEAAGVEEGRWCNKLWEALDTDAVPPHRREEALELLAVLES